MRAKLLILLLVLFFYESMAQKNLLPGYIITLDSDTISGYIDYRNWDKNPKDVTFSYKLHGDLVMHSPTEISGFGVSGEMYVGATVETETSSAQELNLDTSPDLQLRTEAVFLRTLVQGQKSLYYAKNEEGKENFYINRDSLFELLQQKKYLVRQGNNLGQKIAEKKQYLGQLMLYLDDCPDIRSSVSATEYTIKSLVKLFHHYYACVGDSSPFVEQMQEKLVSVGVLSGVSLSHLKFYSNQSSFNYLVKADFSGSTSYTGGVFLEIFIPRTAKKLSINNELIYTSYSVNGQHIDYNDIINTTRLEYSYLKMNNLLRFTYPIGKINAFLNLGLSNGLRLNENNQRAKAYQSDPSKQRVERALADTKNYEQAFLMGAGVSLNKVSIEGRYANGNGMSKYLKLHSATKVVQLFVGYRF